MDEATKAKAIELLRAHPRFQDHFQRAMPKDIVKGSQAEQDAWCFAYASTWPDVVREVKNSVTREDVTNYNRGVWHYIDIPIYLNDEEQRQLEHQVNQNLSREIPENRDDPTMNIIQAEKNAAKYVGDASADKEHRAVSLCWLEHWSAIRISRCIRALVYDASLPRRGSWRQFPRAGLCLQSISRRLHIACLLG